MKINALILALTGASLVSSAPTQEHSALSPVEASNNPESLPAGTSELLNAVTIGQCGDITPADCNDLCYAEHTRCWGCMQNGCVCTDVGC